MSGPSTERGDVMRVRVGRQDFTITPVPEEEGDVFCRAVIDAPSFVERGSDWTYAGEPTDDYPELYADAVRAIVREVMRTYV